MILLYGPPASGKSTFYLRFLANYTRFNNDTFKTSQSVFLNKLTCILEQGKSVVIDNTNEKKEARM